MYESVPISETGRQTESADKSLSSVEQIMNDGDGKWVDPKTVKELIVRYQKEPT